jgi:competence protein ComEC
MGWAVSAVLSLSEWVSGIPNAVAIVPAFGTGALVLFVAAILCATLFVSPLRWAATLPTLLGLWLAAHAVRPDIYVARDGSGAAIRGRDGRLIVLGRAPAFIAEQWLKADGDARKPGAADLRAGANCDGLGCVVERAGSAVALVEHRRGFDRDCRRATLVISRLTAPKDCAASLVVDRAFLAAHGATAIRDGPGGLQLETARGPGDTRPWLPRRKAAAAAPPPAPPANPEPPPAVDEVDPAEP